jgi:hypothetical protein
MACRTRSSKSLCSSMCPGGGSFPGMVYSSPRKGLARRCQALRRRPRSARRPARRSAGRSPGRLRCPPALRVPRAARRS